uniref:BTB domain-containing protein n=1 Tax=Panagrolaimus davidi TaxID=227884 RepID=A0A914Q3U9_9BILA
MSASPKDYIYQIQQERFEIFKSQDPENGHFDITFDIEGKKLHANKFILTPCSDTLKAMLSDRWTTTNDEAVKIEAYSYDNFYQFLTFLYTGSCKLTLENVFQLTDMAEFYAVPFLKEFCENFFLKMEYNVESIEEMFEFSKKYSMDYMEHTIKKFVDTNFEEILSSESLLSYKKPFMDVLASIIHYPWKEKTYEAVIIFTYIYKWIEHQGDVEDESFYLHETAKTEFREKFPQIFSIDEAEMDYGFLKDFFVAKGIITEEQANHVCYTRVTIENNGKVIAGIFDDEIGVRLKIQDRPCNVKRKNTTIARFFNFRFPRPSSPSTITKMKGVDWYLCLDTGGVLTLKHHSVIDWKDYILCEMKSQNEFFITSDVTTNLTVCVKNVKPIF